MMTPQTAILGGVPNQYFKALIHAGIKSNFTKYLINALRTIEKFHEQVSLSREISKSTFYLLFYL